MKELIKPVQLPNINDLGNGGTDPVPLIDLMCPSGGPYMPICPVKVYN